jgi:hypothetical protein
MSPQVFHTQERVITAPCLKLESIRHGLKLALTAGIIVVLFMVNGSLTNLMKCLTPYFHGRAMTTSVQIAPTLFQNHSFPKADPWKMVNCSHLDIDDSINLHFQVCRPVNESTLTVDIDGIILRTYPHEELSFLQEWLRRCTLENFRQACPILQNPNIPTPPNCVRYSAFLDPTFTHLCFNQNYEIEYLVLANFRLSPKETFSFIDFILNA